MSRTANLFVLMPFEAPFDSVYDKAIKPTFEEIGYEVNKADSMDSSQNILKDIVNGIEDADLIVADLTGLNPNVFYEVGIADGLGIPVLLVTQDIDELPFDLRGYNVKEYSTNFVEMEEFTEYLRETANKHLDSGVKFGSPVSDFTNVSIKLPQPVQDEDESEKLEEEESPEPERGYLDYAEEAEERRFNLEHSFQRIEEETLTLKRRVDEIGAEMNKTQHSGSMSPKKVNRLAADAAKELSRYAAALDDHTDSIDKDLNFMMDALQSGIDFADADEPEHRQVLQEQQDELHEFITEVDEVIRALSQFRSEADGLRGMNRKLTEASSSVSSVLTDIIDSMVEVKAKAERMVSLIEQELQTRSEDDD